MKPRPEGRGISLGFIMKFVNWSKTNELAVKQVGQWAVYVSNNIDYDDEKDCKTWKFVIDYLKSTRTEAEYLNYISSIMDGGLFFFETKELAWEFYSMFAQSITDSSGLYASVYSPTGVVLTEILDENS
jgi:hypothetical protein